MVDHNDNPKLVRRIEVMTGVGRRRRWNAAEKARIVAETFAPGAVIAEIARRYDVRAQQLTGWRREAREGRLALPASEGSTFASVVVARRRPGAPTRDDGRCAGAPPPFIEIEAHGLIVRMRETAPAMLIETMLHALRTSA